LVIFASLLGFGLCVVFTIVCVVVFKKRQSNTTHTDVSAVELGGASEMRFSSPSAPTQTNINPQVPFFVASNVHPQMAHTNMMPPPSMYSNNPQMTGLYVQPPVLMPVYMGTNQ